MQDVSLVRRRLLAATLILVPLGVGTKFYAGPGNGWVQAHAGGTLYVIFWTFVVLCRWPRLSPWTAAGGVLVATILLEGLQLWQPPVLETIRDTFVGHAVLGSTFSWDDLPHYAVGAVLGGGVGQMLCSPDATKDHDQSGAHP